MHRDSDRLFHERPRLPPSSRTRAAGSESQNSFLRRIIMSNENRSSGTRRIQFYTQCFLYSVQVTKPNDGFRRSHAIAEYASTAHGNFGSTTSRFSIMEKENQLKSELINRRFAGIWMFPRSEFPRARDVPTSGKTRQFLHTWDSTGYSGRVLHWTTKAVISSRPSERKKLSQR